ncbi:hypothetical protein MNV49_001023 [Pseudohyphozyma bogoriensis]|nr:hypothetical protein MNV49_001023 [Pseudohyphozyma bogoriensis]
MQEKAATESLKTPSRYNIGEVVAVERTAVVKRATHKDDPTSVVVVKIFFYPSTTTIDYAKGEYDRLKWAEGSGGANRVVQLYSTRPPSIEKPYFILEHLDVTLSCLIDYSMRHGQELDVDLVHFIFVQLVDTVTWLHSHERAATDLTVTNIMIGRNGGGFKVKLTELSAVWSVRAPQESEPSPEGDVWRLGAMLAMPTGKAHLILLEQEYLRAEHLEKVNIRHLHAGPRNALERLAETPSNYGRDCFWLMRSLLITDPAKRPTMAQIRDSPFYKPELMPKRRKSKVDVLKKAVKNLTGSSS